MPTESRGRNTVFVDSLANIAPLSPSDACHQLAVRVIEGLSNQLLTTHWVLMELADALCVPTYRAEIARFIRDLANDTGTKVIPPNCLHYERGLDRYAIRQDKE